MRTYYNAHADMCKIRKIYDRYINMQSQRGAFMDVNYEYYKIFYYTAKCGNLTQAAKLLSNNQPNLTRSIKNLEAELGCPLFSRTNRGVKLTPEGEQLYRHVKIAVEQLEAGEAELKQSRALQTGTVFIAASEGALRCLLLPILEAFRSRYPGVRLRISNHSTPQAIAALHETTADFAVVTTPVQYIASLLQTNVQNIQEVAVCSPRFQDMLDRVIPLADLRKHPLITLGADTQSYAFYSAFFAAHDLPFRPDIEAFTADQILPMVESGLGIGIIPKDFIRPSDKVCVINLAEQFPPRSVCLVKRKDQPLSFAARELEKMIIESGKTVSD